MDSKQKRNSWLICLFLVLATVAVYLPVARFEFINYDDPNYVSDNLRIKQGFTVESIKWAFTTNYASNWHPLTWLTHMLDWSLYGSNAGGHHVTNLLLHIANTLLLFVVLRIMTGAVWRSGIVAALFALHPMHVESVAWVSERKDVLSTFFWMLTMFFYARYARERISHFAAISRKALWNYGLALFCFAVGLMAKQMLVTLPFVLLLLDIWPLQRVLTLRQLAKLALEKVPFFLITAILIAIAIWAQKAGGTVASADLVPFDQRIENCVISYFRYFSKMIWPTDLIVFYPYPEIWPMPLFAGSVLFVVLGFALAIWQLKARPFIFVGWCWFVGALVPVIGIMQIGSQSMADRYSYIPFIGLFVALAWSGHNLVSGRVLFLKSASAMVIVVLLVHMTLTVRQVGYWRNSETLFRHGLAASENNVTMHVNLGGTLLDHGMTNAAIEQYDAALKIIPNDPLVHGNLASIYATRENWEDAAKHYEVALAGDPRSPVLHTSVGNALIKQNKWDEAIQHFRTALEISPEYAGAAYNLGTALLHENKQEEAIAVLEKVITPKCDDPVALQLFGRALMSLQRLDQAEQYFRRAIRLRPDFAEAHHSLAALLVTRHKGTDFDSSLDDAIFHYKEAARLNTNNSLAHIQLAAIATSRGDISNTIAEYRASLKIDPNSPEIMNNLAWILATTGDSKLRNGEEAVHLAEKACQLVGFKKPLFIGTLAAAYAEAGNFEKAIEMGDAAYQLANSAGQNEIAQRNLELLKLYRAGHPYREVASSGTKK